MPLQTAEPAVAQPTLLRGSSSVLRRGSSAALRKLMKAAAFGPSSSLSHSENAARTGATADAPKPPTVASNSLSTTFEEKNISSQAAAKSGVPGFVQSSASLFSGSGSLALFSQNSSCREQNPHAASTLTGSSSDSLSNPSQFNRHDLPFGAAQRQQAREEKSASQFMPVQSHAFDDAQSHILASELYQQWQEYANYETSLMLCAGVLYESTLSVKTISTADSHSVEFIDNHGDDGSVQWHDC